MLSSALGRQGQMDLSVFLFRRAGLACLAPRGNGVWNTTTFCIFLFLGWQEYPVLADWKQAGLWRQVCHWIIAPPYHVQPGFSAPISHHLILKQNAHHPSRFTEPSSVVGPAEAMKTLFWWKQVPENTALFERQLRTFKLWVGWSGSVSERLAEHSLLEFLFASLTLLSKTSASSH